LPRASLNGSFVTLPFVSASGATATWQSNAVTWTNPQTSVTTSTNKIKLTITITSGAVTWANATSFAGLDPGPGAGMGGAINVAPSGTAINFTVNVKFEADVGSGFVPLNSVLQGTGGNTLSSFTGAFYWAP
jgi:hypothetical protein